MVTGMTVLSGIVVVCMVAIDDVGWHELMEHSRNCLNTDEAADEAAHHDETGRLIGPALLLKVSFGLGKHTK